MRRLWGWLGRASVASSELSSELPRTGCGVAPPENSVTESRTDSALTRQMVGGIKLSSPGKKSMSEGMFLDVPTMSAPSGKDAEQLHPHRSSALDYASAARDVHSRVYGACTAEAAASESSGLSVGGCKPLGRGPYPPVRPSWRPGRIRGLTKSASEQTTQLEVRSLNFNVEVVCSYGRSNFSANRKWRRSQAPHKWANFTAELQRLKH